MPNFATHAVADEKHGDLFVPLLPKYISNQPQALKAAEDALELFKLYHSGRGRGDGEAGLTRQAALHSTFTNTSRSFSYCQSVMR